MASAIAERLAGSAPIFDHDGRIAHSSVNFITAHDGFTLHDLVSYNERHNHANGENNRDGHSANYSFNHGEEGPTEDSSIRKKRLQQKKNLPSKRTGQFSCPTVKLITYQRSCVSKESNKFASLTEKKSGWPILMW